MDGLSSFGLKGKRKMLKFPLLQKKRFCVNKSRHNFMGRKDRKRKMKKNKNYAVRTMVFGALLLVMVLSLTACGSKEDSDSTVSGTQKEDGKDSVTTKTTETEPQDTRYCDQDDCKMQFPHIHVSMDNWQEYFEFTIGYQFGNGSENMDKYMITKTVFCVREEWMDKIRDINLNYQVGYTEYSVPGEIDWENQMVTVEENAEKTYSEHVDDQWYDTKYDFDENTGLTERTHMASITNDREDYDGTIRIWEPEMLNIGDGGYISLKDQ